jgi:hypothetical protein
MEGESCGPFLTACGGRDKKTPPQAVKLKLPEGHNIMSIDKQVGID